MRERRAQTVLLIRAFEETDREGTIVAMQARAAATRRALRVTGLADWEGDLYEARNIRNGETVVRRSRLLLDSLGHRVPGLRGLLYVARLGASTAPAIIATALVAGLASNALGPQRQVNLLSLPLLGMLAWNLGVYIAWGVGLFVRWLSPTDRRARAPSVGRGVAGHLADLFIKGAIWRRLRGWKRRAGGDAAHRRVITRSVVRFGALWQRSAGALLAARVRRILHVGALSWALGSLASVYLRGLALEYRATWESTWLDAGQVQALMNSLLGPAARLLGTAIPDVAPLRAPGDGSAAAWIHLFAATVLLGVVVPRVGLALFESVRCARLAADVPVDLEEGYYRRLLRDWRGATTSVEIVPYSYAPEREGLDRLKSWLRDYFGARADVRVRAPLGYGDGAGELIGTVAGDGPWTPPRDVGDDLADSNVVHCHVLMFNLAQTPEAEVHGALLEELRTRIGERGGRLLVVIDPQAFARRVRVRSRKRERMRAWQRVAHGAELKVVLLEPGSDEEPSLRALARAIWPAEASEPQEATGP